MLTIRVAGTQACWDNWQVLAAVVTLGSVTLGRGALPRGGLGAVFAPPRWRQAPARPAKMREVRHEMRIRVRVRVRMRMRTGMRMSLR